MAWRGNGSSGELGVDCEKSDSNEWTCKFPDEENNTQAKIVYRGSKDGDLELMKKKIAPQYQDEEDKLLQKAKKGVKVQSSEAAEDPFKGPRE